MKIKIINVQSQLVSVHKKQEQNEEMFDASIIIVSRNQQNGVRKIA